MRVLTSLLLVAYSCMLQGSLCAEKALPKNEPTFKKEWKRPLEMVTIWGNLVGTVTPTEENRKEKEVPVCNWALHFTVQALAKKEPSAPKEPSVTVVLSPQMNDTKDNKTIRIQFDPLDQSDSPLNYWISFTRVSREEENAKKREPGVDKPIEPMMMLVGGPARYELVMASKVKIAWGIGKNVGRNKLGEGTFDQTPETLLRYFGFDVSNGSIENVTDVKAKQQ